MVCFVIYGSDVLGFQSVVPPYPFTRFVPDVAWGVSHLEPLELMDVEDWELIQSSYLGSSSWSAGWSCDEQVENLLSWSSATFQSFLHRCLLHPELHSSGHSRLAESKCPM